MIVCGDIGGTKTVIAAYQVKGRELNLVRDQTFPSGKYPSLEAILDEFGTAGIEEPIQAGCFGVAGAVVEGKCQATNLPWSLDERLLADKIGAPKAKLLNDLEAAAYGMLFLKADELHTLNSGNPARKGNVAVLAAGTGLGEAMLFWDGQNHQPVASEGGHASFAPQTDEEIELLKYLRKEFGGHVSYERVISGNGLQNIYTFLRDTGFAEEPDWLAEKLAKGDPNAVIAETALNNEHTLCMEALRMFAEIYGAEAGNLALKCLSIGGVFIGGGIAPKILPALERGFLSGFTAKGRFSKLLNSIPVKVALNPRAPLIGAAHYALRYIG